MTQTEALKLALEALDFSTSPSPCVEELQDDAIAAIKEALAQPEQKPVAWMLNGFPYKEKQVQVGGSCRGQEFPNQTPLYTTPPQRTWVNATTWRGLTSEEIRQLEKENTVNGYHGDYCPTWDLIQATEAKLKEKNT